MGQSKHLLASGNTSHYATGDDDTTVLAAGVACCVRSIVFTSASGSVEGQIEDAGGTTIIPVGASVSAPCCWQGAVRSTNGLRVDIPASSAIMVEYEQLEGA